MQWYVVTCSSHSMCIRILQFDKDCQCRWHVASSPNQEKGSMNGQLQRFKALSSHAGRDLENRQRYVGDVDSTSTLLYKAYDLNYQWLIFVLKLCILYHVYAYFIAQSVTIRALCFSRWVLWATNYTMHSSLIVLLSASKNLQFPSLNFCHSHGHIVIVCITPTMSDGLPPQ